jgi:hypothetical protein
VTSTSTTFPSWTYTPYAEQFRSQSNEITAQALSVFNTSNHLAINALTAARETVKLGMVKNICNLDIEWLKADFKTHYPIMVTTSEDDDSLNNIIFTTDGNSSPNNQQR